MDTSHMPASAPAPTIPEPNRALRVVFDLDDTLYPEREFALSGFRAAGQWAAEALGVDGLAQEMTELFEDGHLGPLFRIALERHKPDFSARDLEALVEAWRTHDPEIRLFDDAIWALEHYASQGPIGLITDGTEAMQSSKVRALQIASYFHEIIMTDGLGGRSFRKPHPLSFERMEAALALDDAQFVYVADNPAKDFVTPNARGWISIQVKRPVPGTHDPDMIAEGGAPRHIISDLKALREILGT